MSHPDTPETTQEAQPTVADLEQQLLDIQEQEATKLGVAAARYASLKLLADRVSKAKSKASARLLELMEEQGVEGVNTPVAKVGLSQRRTIGIAEGNSPEDMLANKEKARKWVEEYNPVREADIRVTNLKATYEAVLVENPDAPLPDFLVEHEVPTLSVRKA